ncbi:MAG: M48 family metallopeptidase [Armatimonadetes bacterium]|nr:M48 family metallopeptidase [Armatimonadota bacterium]
MYAQISSNVWKSVLLVVVFMAVLIGLGYLFSEVTGFPYILPVAVVIAVAGSIGSYYYSDRIVLGMSQARPANGEEHAFIMNSVEGLALAAGIPVPRIYVIDDTAPNAFATGRDPQHAVICVTTGLMQKLDRIELEAVIGHEMAHIKDYDIRFMALVAILAGTIVLISDWLLRSMWWGGGRDRDDDREGGSNPILMLVAIAAAILAPIIATLIQLSISRKREYLADAQGALLTRYPDGLASALAKIAADPEPLEAANKATAHLYIYNPLREHGGFLNSLFSTHPPIEDRIRRLKAM